VFLFVIWLVFCTVFVKMVVFWCFPHFLTNALLFSKCGNGGYGLIFLFSVFFNVFLFSGGIFGGSHFLANV